MGSKTRMMGLPDGQKSFKTIPACDGQGTDGQRTSFDGKDGASILRRAGNEG